MSETTTKTETKSRPILFSGPMVRAIRDGRKTQTRRVVRMQGDDMKIRDDGFFGEHDEGSPFRFHVSDLRCPYGVPGDELWVREEHYRFGHWEPVLGVRTKSGRHQKWQFVGDSEEVLFECPFELSRSMNAPYQSRPGWYKRLARFMPRWACRLTLTVTDGRVEPLQDISGADARAEGCDPDWDAFHEATEAVEGWQEPDEFIEECEEECDWVNFGRKLVHSSEHKEWQSDRESFARRLAFQHLWQSINGPDSWAANPWVWVVTFERKAVS